MENQAGVVKILWVGNSFTFFPVKLGGIPGILNMLARVGGTDCFDVTPVLKGGATLHDLADEFERSSQMLSSPIDVVVLQDQSTVPAGYLCEKAGLDPDGKIKCVSALKERFAPILKRMQEHGTHVLLYQTWGRDADMHKVPDVLGNFEEMSKKLAEGYQSYAEALRAEGVQVDIVRVGDAYVKVSNKYSGKTIWRKLCADDNAHPTLLAGFLIASVFAVALGNLMKDASRFPARATIVDAGQQWQLDSSELNALCDAAGLK